MRTIIAIAAAATALLGAAPAFAGDQRAEGATVQVSYADLDLSRSSGRAVLQARVRGAIDRVCPRADIRDLRMGVEVQKCRAAALTGAQQQMAALYANRQLAQAAIQVRAGAK